MRSFLPRSIIESLVRKTITEIQDSPQRSTRNLIDMALNFSTGRFQNHFFQCAQTMLEEENSSYYKLIPDIAASVDADRLVTFGLNLGYNSCTAGANTIRVLENKEHFNIPWSVILILSGTNYVQKKSEYHSILEQGKSLGIYTWMIFVMDGMEQLLDLAAAYPDCAFVFYSSPDEITDAMLDEAETFNHLMFAVRHMDGIENACYLLRSRHFLYSVFHIYGELDLNEILNDEWLCDTESLHPAFTGFLPALSCTEQTHQAVYEYVYQTRNNQKYSTVLWDIIHDSRYIDSIISDDSCMAAFDPEGYLYTFQQQPKKLDYNFFAQSLFDIFKQAFPKTDLSAGSRAAC